MIKKTILVLAALMFTVQAADLPVEQQLNRFLGEDDQGAVGTVEAANKSNQEQEGDGEDGGEEADNRVLTLDNPGADNWHIYAIAGVVLLILIIALICLYKGLISLEEFCKCYKCLGDCAEAT